MLDQSVSLLVKTDASHTWYFLCVIWKHQQSSFVPCLTSSKCRYLTCSAVNDLGWGDFLVWFFLISGLWCTGERGCGSPSWPGVVSELMPRCWVAGTVWSSSWWPWGRAVCRGSARTAAGCATCGRGTRCAWSASSQLCSRPANTAAATAPAASCKAFSSSFRCTSLFCSLDPLLSGSHCAARCSLEKWGLFGPSVSALCIGQELIQVC